MPREATFFDLKLNGPSGIMDTTAGSSTIKCTATGCRGGALRPGQLRAAIAILDEGHTCDDHAIVALSDVEANREHALEALRLEAPRVILKWLCKVDASSALLSIALASLAGVFLGTKGGTMPIHLARQVCDQVCTLLRAHATDVNIAVSGGVILTELVKTLPSVEHAVGAISVVLSSHCRGHEGAFHNCATAVSIAATKLSTANMLISAGVVDSLVTGLRHHMEAPATAEVACNALQALAQTAVIPGESHCMVTPGTIDVVLRAAKRYKESRQLLGAVLRILHAFAQASGGPARLVAAGALHAYVAFMTQFPDEAMAVVCADSLTSLYLQLKDSGVGKKLVDAGVVPALLAALHAHTDDAVVASRCTKLLVELISSCDGSKTRILDDKVAALLIKLGRKHIDGEPPRQVLFALTTCDDRGVKCLVDAGLVPLLIAVMRKYQSASPGSEDGGLWEVAIAGVTRIAKLVPARGLLVRMGAVEAVCAGFVMHASEEDAAMWCCSALDQMAEDDLAIVRMGKGAERPSPPSAPCDSSQQMLRWRGPCVASSLSCLRGTRCWSSCSSETASAQSWSMPCVIILVMPALCELLVPHCAAWHRNPSTASLS